MTLQRAPPLPTIQELIRIYKLGAIKRLSQNFLLNQSAIKKLVRCAGDLTDCHVIEVGPGPGGITRQILSADIKHLSVIEKDERFIPILKSLSAGYKFTGKDLRIFHGDVLKFNMAPLFPFEEKKKWTDLPPNLHVIGNLPFNISSPLIILWLRQISERTGAWSYGRTRLTLTFQKEVGERMVADILHKQRSRLSIMCQHLCDVTVKHVIPGKVFVPPPEVDVAVVHFVPLKYPRIEQPYHIVEKLVRHTFHYRQKFCRRGLVTLFPAELAHLCDEMLSKADVDPTTRPQELSMEDFRRLCNFYGMYCERHPRLFNYYYRDREPDLSCLQGLTIDSA
ncbi:dimethyladenosine transferase 1, mitochondrial-like [Watersipora subatra]|uniref:dimethyladenosine transferase 1, mitochondrial-like n=1 Tax=Watersipora subatra TaxID=2589382 RepID=UPI00355B6D5B